MTPAQVFYLAGAHRSPEGAPATPRRDDLVSVHGFPDAQLGSAADLAMLSGMHFA